MAIGRIETFLDEEINKEQGQVPAPDDNHYEYGADVREEQ